MSTRTQCLRGLRWTLSVAAEGPRSSRRLPDCLLRELFRPLGGDASSVPLRSENRPDPVQRSEAAGIVMYEERPVGFEHQKTDGLREAGGQAAGVKHLTAGDDETHGPRTVLSVSDRACPRSPVTPPASGSPDPNAPDGRASGRPRGSGSRRTAALSREAAADRRRPRGPLRPTAHP